MFSLNTIKQDFELVTTMTKATIKSRYRKTFAGFLWVILNPILTFSVQAVIFSHILKINMDNYFLFLLSGVIPWIFITTTITMTVGTYVASRPILMSFKLDPRILVLAQAIDNFFTFLVAFSILLIMNHDINVLSNLKIPMFILATIALTIGVFFISAMLATIHVFMRDTQFIVQFGLNLLYFITPVFYPKELVPSKYQWAIDFNPIYILIKPFQSIFWKYDPGLFLEDYLKAVALLAIIIIVNIVYWRRKKDALYFKI
ncbi:MAG: ABC transporter permease [Bdellovibrionales bacterium]|nr:ABC transporter permease [Bdellovibrionales bacterium]